MRELATSGSSSDEAVLYACATSASAKGSTCTTFARTLQLFTAIVDDGQQTEDASQIGKTKQIKQSALSNVTNAPIDARLIQEHLPETPKALDFGGAEVFAALDGGARLRQPRLQHAQRVGDALVLGWEAGEAGAQLLHRLGVQLGVDVNHPLVVALAAPAQEHALHGGLLRGGLLHVDGRQQQVDEAPAQVVHEHGERHLPVLRHDNQVEVLDGGLYLLADLRLR